MMNKNQRYYWLGKDQPSSQDTFFLDALDADLWVEGSQEKWDACWQTDMPNTATFEQLDSNKTINHIPGNNALTIKSDLYNTLVAAKQRLNGLLQEQRYNFFPKTFSMPEDYFEFQQVAAANPDCLWIKKPKNLSRGRGIEMVKHPSTVPLGEEWLIQRYIEDPHLYKGHKYVLRCYALITSVEPLRCYWYKEGSMKLASDTYTCDNFDNPYSYLTNPDINEENIDAEVPVIFIPFANYKQWLRDEGIDDVKLFEHLEDLIGLTVIAAREAMRRQSQTISTNAAGCYELIGLDCMIDNNLKPWILECNLSPSLGICTEADGGSETETRTKKALVRDIVNMMGLNDTSPKENLSYEEIAVKEQQRAGDFSCIFPTEKANDYFNCFPVPRYADIASLPRNTHIDIDKIQLGADDDSEITFEDSLLLLSPRTEKITQKNDTEFIAPNEIATWIWLKNAERNSPQEIINELSILLPNVDTISEEALNQSVSKQVWDMLADWSYAGLFTTKQHNGDTTTALLKTSYLNVANVTLELRFLGAEIKNHLAPLLTNTYINNRPINQNATDSLQVYTVDIIPSTQGYYLTNNTTIIAEHCKLSEIAPALVKFAINTSVENNQIVAIKSSIVTIDNKNIMLLGNQTTLLDAFTYFLSQKKQAQIISSTSLLALNESEKKPTTKATTSPLYLPRIDYFDCYPKTKEHSWIVAEDDKLEYWLAPMSDFIDVSKTNKSIKIEGVLFLECKAKNEKDKSTKHLQAPSDVQLQTITTAQALSELAKHCVFHSTAKNNNVKSIHYLADWIRDIPASRLSIESIGNTFEDTNKLANIFNGYIQELP